MYAIRPNSPAHFKPIICVTEIESKTPCMLGTHFITELHPQPHASPTTWDFTVSVLSSPTPTALQTMSSVPRFFFIYCLMFQTARNFHGHYGGWHTGLKLSPGQCFQTCLQAHLATCQSTTVHIFSPIESTSLALSPMLIDSYCAITLGFIHCFSSAYFSLCQSVPLAWS